MSDSLLLEDERRIEEREQKATGGRWWWQVSGRFAISLDARRVAPWSTVIQSSSAGMIISDEDKGFISHARTDIPLLLSRLKAERGKNEKLMLGLDSALRDFKTMEQETAESMAAIGGTMERLVAEREEAVGQVAVIIKATELCVDSLEEFTTYDYGRGMASDPLVMNAESVIAQAREALASSAPLVAAHDATALEGAANLAACCHSGGEAAVAIRARATELRKQAKGE